MAEMAEKMTMEEESSETAEEMEVSGCGQGKCEAEKEYVSTATQTAVDVGVEASEGKGRVEKREEESASVQITASLSDLLHRIDSFVQYKRHLVDVSNQLEFCHTSSTGRIHKDSTCARTDAAYVKRGPDPSHITTHRVQNTSGPSAPPLPALEQLRHDLNPAPSSWNRFKLERSVVNSSALYGLSERVSNVEQFTDLYGGGPAPRNLIQRIQNLELRILELEGRSPEYFHRDTASKSLPQPKKIQSAIVPLPSGHPAHMTSHN